IFDKIFAGASQRHPLISIDDFDVHLAKDGHDIVNLIRRNHFRGQHIVDVVIGQIALFLAQIDELFDLLHVLLFHRLPGAFGGQFFCRYRMVVFASSLLCSSWRSFCTTSWYSSILSLLRWSSFRSSAARISTLRFRLTVLRYLRQRSDRQSAAILSHSASRMLSPSNANAVISGA